MDLRSLDLVRRGEAENGRLFGPFFLGAVICFFLWGIQVTQSYYYYKTYRHTDGKWTKGAVIALFVLDAVQTVCTAEGTWRYTVEAWGDQDGFVLIRSWGVDVLPFADACITSLVHAFYAHKIWSLLKAPYNYLWTVIVLSFSCLQLVGGSGAAFFFLAIQNSISTVHRAKTWVMIWHLSASVTDIIVAGIMSLKLSQSRTGFKRTDDMISKLIQVVVETGVATAIIQIVDIVLYLGWPLHAYHTVPASVSPKFYSNSMLALLNSRQLPHSNIDSIQVHTTQTLTVPSEFELKDGASIKSPGGRRSRDSRAFAGSTKGLAF